ncbi:MAG: DUF4855 domain-containing protein, partial [Muribaculaceae bacterium]
YQGSIHRPDWTENQLTPYVTHTFTDGHTDWFFNSFLFLEFTNNWEVAYGYGYGSRYAKKGDWEWLLNRINCSWYCITNIRTNRLGHS